MSTPTTSAVRSWRCSIWSRAAAPRLQPWPGHQTCPQAWTGCAIYRLLDRRPNLDAVFVASDLMAAGALRALRRYGRRVPDDVAVIGFEDSPLARHTDPKLTTVRQPIEEMGKRLATELLALIARDGEDPSHVVLDTTLVIRESA
jgi:DNA-binding LacI/PurR family transcriptional regulator